MHHRRVLILTGHCAHITLIYVLLEGAIVRKARRADHGREGSQVTEKISANG